MRFKGFVIFIAWAAVSPLASAEDNAGNRYMLAVSAVANIAEALKVCPNLQGLEDYMREGQETVIAKWKNLGASRFSESVDEYTVNSLRPRLKDPDAKVAFCDRMGKGTEKLAVETKIKHLCAKKHPDSYAGQAKCVTSEMDGWLTLMGRKPQGE